jgi:hypothetical protein
MLGAGNCGKSTILKQARILFDDHGFTKVQTLQYIPSIRHNVVLAMEILISKSEELADTASAIPPVDHEAKASFLQLIGKEYCGQPSVEIDQVIKQLWIDE